MVSSIPKKHLISMLSAVTDQDVTDARILTNSETTSQTISYSTSSKKSDHPFYQQITPSQLVDYLRVYQGKIITSQKENP